MQFDIRLNEGFDAGQIESLLSDSYSYLLEPPVAEHLSFYDTFDWRLFNNSLTLHFNERDLVLSRLPQGESMLSQSAVRPAVFVRDLPEGALKQLLSSIIEVRALLPLGKIFTRSRTYRILNQDKKTVACLVFVQAGTSSANGELILANYLSLSPLRGYPRYERQLAERIQGLGISVVLWEELYRMALQAASKVPGSYSTRLDLQLSPEMRSDEATRVILRRLLEVMRANEDGIRADIDIEFLHDYRVATRRTRSALSQIKDIFPAADVARFRQDFGDLGELSNELRDLDVYLLAEPVYRKLLPPAIQNDITPLFDYLRSRRPQALSKIVDYLNSPAYERLLREWKAFLDEPRPLSSAAPNADRPAIDLACERIYKRYRRVIKDGSYLLDHPDDALMHPLRIQCKKLRYLIEFFASLFPPKKIKKLVDQLKSLQDNLGEFNDLRVQQVKLLEISTQLPVSDAGSRGTLVAVGALVRSLAYRQQAVRSEFAQTFNDFASKDNQAQYRKLFHSKPQEISDDDDRPVQQ